MAKIQIPDFEFSGFYYPEVLADLIEYMRQNCPEFTDEDELEPFVQIMRAFALGCHTSNVLIDSTSVERFFDTCNLLTSLKSHLRLIGYELRSMSPASGDVLARLSVPFDAEHQLINPLRTFSTKSGDTGQESIDFECIDGVSLAKRTDEINTVFSFDGENYADHSAKARPGGGTFSPNWSTLGAGKMLYFGMDSVMPTKFLLDIITKASRIYNAAWEYSERGFDHANPDRVTKEADGLVFNVDGLLGTANRAGSNVRVQCALTGAYQDLTSTFLSGATDEITLVPVGQTLRMRFRLDTLFPANADGREVVIRCSETGNYTVGSVQYIGGHNYVTMMEADPFGWPEDVDPLVPFNVANYIVDVGPNVVKTLLPDAYMAQVLPSTDTGHYLVGTSWRGVPEIADETNKLMLAGSKEIAFALPQDSTRCWTKTEVNGVSAYWLRLRIIDAKNTGAIPVIGTVDPAKGDQWVLFSVTQGLTVEDDPVDSSDGTPGQEVALSRFPVIDKTIQIIVEEKPGLRAPYSQVSSFLNSNSASRHFTVRTTDLGQTITVYGDGKQGKIPPAGSDNMRAIYRIADDVNGNVPAGAISVNSDGVAYIDSIYNPRPTAGYRSAEGSTDEDIARLKIAGPASLRVLQRALNVPDAEYLVVNEFTATGGSRPVARAKGIERGAGSKTILLVLVGVNGGFVSSDALREIEVYFNGDIDKKVNGVLVANQKVVAENYIPRPVNITAVVTNGNAASAQAALTALVTPLAKNEDGSDAWTFAGEVPYTRIAAAIMRSEPNPTKVFLGGDGTGTVTATGIYVVGTGTQFTKQLNRGDRFKVGSDFRIISEIIDDTHLELVEQFDSAVSSASFKYEMGDIPLGAKELPVLGTVRVRVVRA